MEDWYLRRQGYPGTEHHLNILLGDKEKLIIGRKLGGRVDIVCNGKTVSREHCILRYVDSYWQIVDLESMNGVYVNKVKILPNTPTSLALGDVLGIGAIDISEQDYYVFDVCKTVVKDENENLNANVLLVPLEKVENNGEHKSNTSLPSKCNVPANEGNLGNQIKQEQLLSDELSPETNGASIDQEKDVQARDETTASKIVQTTTPTIVQTTTPTIVQTTTPTIVQTTASTIVQNLKATDPKLTLQCVVVVEKLSNSKLRKAGPTKTHRKPKTVPVRGKKRVYQLADSEDDEVGQSVSVNSSGSPVCWIPMEVLKEKNSDGKITDCQEIRSKKVDVQPRVRPVSTAGSAETTVKSLKPSQDNRKLSENKNNGGSFALDSTLQPRPASNFVVQKLENNVITEQISSVECRNTAVPKIEKNVARPFIEAVDDGSNDCISFQLTQNPMWEIDDDDDVIVLSSDEETFSIPRFKTELPDDISKQTTDKPKRTVSPVVQDEHLDNGIERASSSSDEGDSPFFPQLSQGILDEIAAEEEEEEEEVFVEGRTVSSTAATEGNKLEHSSSVGNNAKLDSLVASARFKAHERTTLPTAPKSIPVHRHQRFPLTTAGEPLKKTNEPRLEESAGPSRGKISSNSGSRRSVVAIPMRPRKPLKKSNKIDSVRGELIKEYGSYCRSVNESTLKKNSIIYPPESAALTTPSMKTASIHSSSSRRSSISKVPKTSQANPVKAKVTKQTRGDLLTADLVGEDKIASEEMKMRAAGSATALSSYNIPKKSQKVDSGISSDLPASTTAQKRKLSIDEDSNSESATNETVETSGDPGTSCTFKRPTKRVARGTSHVNESNEPPSSSSYSKKPIHRPRDEALPLGRDRRPNQPFKSSTNNYKSGQQQKNGMKDGQRNGHSISGALRHEENSENCNQYHSSSDVTLPISSSDQAKLSIPCDPALNPLTTGLPKPGILSLGVRRNGAIRYNVRFSEKNEIREIEARTPSLHARYPCKSPVRPIDVQTLKKDILLRICNWSYNWIAEQQDRDEPPPLLNEVKAENSRIIPKLTVLPVLSEYNSLEAYFAIFHPLMLHEIWANICKDIELERTVWQTLIHITTETDGGCTILHCETLVSLGTTRLKDLDLVALSVPLKPNVLFQAFGIVENVEIRKVTSTHPPNRRLLEVRKRPENPDCRILFNLRIKASNVPLHLDNIFTITSVTPLRPVIKQFLLHAELDCSPLCDVILHPGDNKEAFKLDMVDKEGNKKLNPVQHKAVESITSTILNAPEDEPKVALLQGPPGTGKSHVIVELVLRMIFMHYEKTCSWPRILICAPSNNAVDEIAIRLCQARDAINSKFQIVRIGVPSSMHSSVENISLDHLAQKVHEQFVSQRESPESLKLRNLREELKNLSKRKHSLITSIEAANKKGEQDEARLYGRKLEVLEAQIEGVDRSFRECHKNHVKYFNSIKERDSAKSHVVVRANVICTTLNSCRSKEMENLFLMRRSDHRDPKSKFLCCIIDEASQCTEPESLTPLALGISKLVMIGDPDQLPATVASQCALKNRFDQSLFNRFYSSRMSGTGENAEPVMMLDTQYRMASSICEWPSKYFYGGKLKTAADLNKTGPCHDYRVLNLLDGREKLDTTDGKSMMNEGEAALVAKMVDVIISSPSTRGKTIGVITFYQGQKQCILDTLKEQKIGREVNRVEVNTVDSFQGREKDIVIVSCVRARDSGGDIGFISSLQRINVALTRAKESLIVCGHFLTLQVNEAWKDLIKNAHNRGVAHCVTSSYTSANLKPLIMRQS